MGLCYPILSSWGMDYDLRLGRRIEWFWVFLGNTLLLLLFLPQGWDWGLLVRGMLENVVCACVWLLWCKLGI
ncbi:hypothetical protein HDV62DRAFT_369176 [Trichoderma sp. SZMC 28011]